MARRLTHVDERGQARMVDVTGKEATVREAVAESVVTMDEGALALARGGAVKGDVLAVARIAGIQAAKRTSELVPLCHPIFLSHVALDVTSADDPPRVVVRATVRTTSTTGVEMEALTAASVAGLTVYDMLKAVCRGMEIEVRLLEKRGGRSGTWTREGSTP